MKRRIIISSIVFLLLAAGVFYFYNEPFACPVPGEGNLRIRNDGRGNGYFASERSGRRTHEGIDLLGDIGAPVLAARTGFVAAARRTRGMGNFIVLKHAGELTTIYGHLLSIYVQEKQFVWRGQIIGCIGKTGNANYRGILPHLHFEVRKGGIPVDPLVYLNKPT